MMYGFGDEPIPSKDSVELMETLVIEHLHDVLAEAVDVAEWKGQTIDDHCIIWSIRQDKGRFKRIKELLDMNIELKKTKDEAKKDLQEPEEWA